MGYSPLQLADAFIQAGELADALDALDQHLSANPADDNARRLQAGVLLRLGGADNLRAALATLARISTPTARDHLHRALILEQQGEADSALAAMQAAHDSAPGDERLTEHYITLLVNHGQAQTALALVRSQPRTWRWLQWEGDLLVKLGDDHMATARYGLALAQLDEQHDPAVDRYLAPVMARLLLARAHAYRRLGDFASAEAHYTSAGDFIPDDPAIPFNRGLLRAAQGDLEGAVALCRPALDAASDVVRAGLRGELADSRYRGLAARL